MKALLVIALLLIAAPALALDFYIVQYVPMAPTCPTLFNVAAPCPPGYSFCSDLACARGVIQNIGSAARTKVWLLRCGDYGSELTCTINEQPIE